MFDIQESNSLSLGIIVIDITTMIQRCVFQIYFTYYLFVEFTEKTASILLEFQA